MCLSTVWAPCPAGPLSLSKKPTAFGPPLCTAGAPRSCGCRDAHLTYSWSEDVSVGTHALPKGSACWVGAPLRSAFTGSYLVMLEALLRPCQDSNAFS